MNLEAVTFEDASDFISKNADAIIAVDGETDEYRALNRKGIFCDLIQEKGKYSKLIEKVWFHFHNSSDSVVEDYHVFIPNTGIFVGKYSKKVNVEYKGTTHSIQMTIYPLEESKKYFFVFNELDKSQYIDEDMTDKKVTTIQNTYLFSMYIDLVRNTISSISITEMSDEVINQQLSYTDWRMKIVNMIWPDDQELFLERSDPEYLKKNINPGRTSSFDCLMLNLEGQYIWVKLIFSRAETNNEDDYRFVYMVQNIHENAVELMSTLKKYEELASKDPLTSVYNHGRIETEICNAVENKKKNNENVAIMMLDIDFFKRVNDNFGHSIGDITLVHFTEVITEHLRDHNAIIGRWGGEEFVVVCYDTDSNKASFIAEALRKKVEEEPFNRVGHITCSIGVTSIRSEDHFKDAFERMDDALYNAKLNGRNRVIAG